MSELLAANLRRLGHRVVGIASDGREAVDMALRLKPDLVIMDIHMPGLDGLEASDAILSVQRVPIVFITGMANDRDLLRAIDQRVISYLIKPFGPAQLKVAVAFAIAQCREPALPAA